MGCGIMGYIVRVNFVYSLTSAGEKWYYNIRTVTWHVPVMVALVDDGDGAGVQVDPEEV